MATKAQIEYMKSVLDSLKTKDFEKIFLKVRDDHIDNFDEQLAPADFDVIIREVMEKIMLLPVNPKRAYVKECRKSVTDAICTMKYRNIKTGKSLTIPVPKSKSQKAARHADTKAIIPKPDTRPALRDTNGDIVPRENATADVILYYVELLTGKARAFHNDYALILNQKWDSLDSVEKDKVRQKLDECATAIINVLEDIAGKATGKLLLLNLSMLFEKISHGPVRVEDGKPATVFCENRVSQNSGDTAQPGC